MKWSKYFLFTLKESPSDAEIPSHQLMIRAGLINKVAQGIYTYGPLAQRSLLKLSRIIRQELEKSHCIEMLMPMVQPKELWSESGRWETMGDLLLRFKNRTENEWCLGGTHEEVITDYVRSYLKSYRSLPFTLFQIQTKYRDEIRPRFGLMRGREFLMKDAYSFDLDKEGALKSYEILKTAYVRIFSQLGLDYRMVQADSGDIGGDLSHEFHVLAESGEDHLLVADDDESFAANAEVCPVFGNDEYTTLEIPDGDEMEEFETMGLRTIQDLAEYLKCEANDLVKTLFYKYKNEKEEDWNFIVIVLRGGDEFNPFKIKNTLKLSSLPEPATAEEVKELTGASPGSCGPVGVKAPVYMDYGLTGKKNWIVGANKDDVHVKNVNPVRDFDVEQAGDFRYAQEGDLSPSGKGKLKSIRGIEVGHIFYLGQKYSQSMKLQYLDKNGKTQPVEMGCYGIGVSRLLQASVEQNHDKNGVVWPLPLAPFSVHICHLDPKEDFVNDCAEKIYQTLNEQGIDTFMDDRNERPGVKFKDADLLGFPLRLVVGKRGVEQGQIEIVERKSGEKQSLPVEEVVTYVEKWFEDNGGVKRL